MARIWNFSPRSIKRLDDVNSDLVKLMCNSIYESPYDFGITCGLRTQEEQAKLVADGLSQTMNSKHLTGDAVDISVYYRGRLTWDFHYYKEVARHIKIISKELNVPIIWGGDWKTLKDGPHFEITQ